MILTIRRGARQIGGSCVELESGGHRLVLDLGLPLSNPDGSPFEFDPKLSPPELTERKVLPDISGLYAHDEPGKVALFLTHVHQDHCGLAAFVHPDVPVFATRGTQALLDVSRIFMRHFPRIGKTTGLEERKPVSFGPFKVTPIPVDHSAPDAVALLVEDGQRRVLYSGDLRRRSFPRWPGPRAWSPPAPWGRRRASTAGRSRRTASPGAPPGERGSKCASSCSSRGEPERLSVPSLSLLPLPGNRRRST